MVLKRRISGQVKKPTGYFGRLVARKMNREHDEVTRWGLGHIGVPEDGVVLDIGCGGGRNLSNLTRLMPLGHVVGVDHSRDMVLLSKRLNRGMARLGRLETIEATVSHLPFREGTFDAVTAVETYFFWPDLVNDFREVLRVIRPEGVFLLVSEQYKHPDFERRNSEWEKLAGFSTNTPEELRCLLLEAGYCSVESYELEERNWLAVRGIKPSSFGP